MYHRIFDKTKTCETMEQGVLTLPNHLNLPHVLWDSCCSIFNYLYSVFVDNCFSFCPLHCPSFGLWLSITRFLASSSFLHACTFSTLNKICASHIKLGNFSIYLKRLYRYETLKPKQKQIYLFRGDSVRDWKKSSLCMSLSFFCTIFRK